MSRSRSRGEGGVGNVRPPEEASSPAIAASMRGNRSRDTGPEVALRRELRRRGLRGYRLDAKWLPGRPDVAFTRKRVAVFVHGCFWHRCPRCKLPMPKTNTSYWRWKFRRNVNRDKSAIRDLEEMGWVVVRVWGCEISEAVDECAARVGDAIEVARDGS